MSETNTDAANDANDVTTSTNGAGSSETSSEADSAGRGREARYRVERNEARAEVERLTGVVEGLQKQIVGSMIGDLKPEAFFAALGDDGMAGLLDEDGNVNADKVTETVGVVRETFGIPEGPRSPQPDPNQGQSYGSEAGAGVADSWTASFAQGATP